MRILWLSVELPDRGGQGGQRRQFHQIKALAARGHEITVVTPAGGPHNAESLARIATVRRPRLTVRGRAVLFALGRLHRMVADPRWDAVVVSHHESARLVPEGIRTPVLLDVHNVMSHWRLRTGDAEAAALARRQEECALSRASAATTCSELEAERLLSMHPDLPIPVFAAPLGVDPEEWPERPFDREHPVVALFGSWFWAPNRAGLRWFAAEVWPRVHALDPGAEAVVAGAGIPADLVLPAGMTTVGRVDDLASFTAGACVVATPVFDGVGAAVKFAESLASGAAVAATSDAANAFPPLPLAESALLVSDDADQWVEWIARRLRLRNDERAPSTARSLALSSLSWDSAVDPIERWLATAGLGIPRRGER